jgi:alpha-mannosidase
MALTIEWTRRIDNWRKEIHAHLYRPLGSLDLEGFVTHERLGAEKAAKGSFSPMPAGTRWGGKWEYCWFRSSLVTPREAAGKRLVLSLNAGGEGLLYVNGGVWSARDQEHDIVTLSRSARAGERFRLLAEIYAGHGPMVCSTGPVPPGRLTVPEPGPAQSTVGECTYGIWQEEVYQLLMDVETLYGLRSTLDVNSLRVSEIDAGLRDFTTIVDFELPREKMLSTVARCRRRLAPLMACRNGSTAPTLYAFGHAHIDVCWLWPHAETERKVARTFSNQLGLIDEYPGYRFLQSEPHLYQLAKDLYPEMYQRIRKAVKQGRVVPEGGMWVEADTNISGGEALIRQFLHGMRFFRAEFGVDNELLWLPDVFGYSGALPQIMRGCGILYFSTAKIFWAYNGGETFPYNTFTWEGIDGSTVLSHFTGDYNSQMDAVSVQKRWSERVQKDGVSSRMVPFGFGDGGGGPTRDHLEYARRMANLEGAPLVRHSHPLDFFRMQEKKAADLPRYTGELYFQAHRGTYTSQARTKRANRKSEIALREAETWASLARVLRGRDVPAADLDAAWKLLLVNQFHDIIPGSSIARVYEEALEQHAQVQASAEAVTAASTGALAGGQQGRAVAVFNSLSWERSALVELPGAPRSVTDSEGRDLPTQTVDGRCRVEVRVPSCGWTTVALAEGDAQRPRQYRSSSLLRATRRTLENERIALTFNDRGEITSLHDKESGAELVDGPCGELRMYKDVPTAWDAWDLDSMYALTPVDLPERASIEVLDQGPLVARLRISRRINESDLTQVVSIRRGSRRVDFETAVDWRESHKLLKVCFPVRYRAADALHEIQFGHIARPTHLSRQFDADRFEVSAHRWSALVEEGRGFAVLNDCKYGVNVLGGSVNLTLLKSAMAPDMNADKGTQLFTYALYSWNGSLSSSGLVREGYELNCPVVSASGGVGEKSLIRVNSPHIVLETVKPAENGDADLVVLRLYESMRTATVCTLTLDLPVVGVEEADMRERATRPLETREGKVALEFRPFEIKTLLVRCAPQRRLVEEAEKPPRPRTAPRRTAAARGGRRK